MKTALSTFPLKKLVMVHQNQARRLISTRDVEQWLSSPAPGLIIRLRQAITGSGSVKLRDALLPVIDKFVMTKDERGYSGVAREQQDARRPCPPPSTSTNQPAVELGSPPPPERTVHSRLSYPGVARGPKDAQRQRPPSSTSAYQPAPSSGRAVHSRLFYPGARNKKGAQRQRPPSSTSSTSAYQPAGELGPSPVERAVYTHLPCPGVAGRKEDARRQCPPPSTPVGERLSHGTHMLPRECAVPPPTTFNPDRLTHLNRVPSRLSHHGIPLPRENSWVTTQVPRPSAPRSAPRMDPYASNLLLEEEPEWVQELEAWPTTMPPCNLPLASSNTLPGVYLFDPKE